MRRVPFVRYVALSLMAAGSIALAGCDSGASEPSATPSATASTPVTPSATASPTPGTATPAATATPEPSPSEPATEAPAPAVPAALYDGDEGSADTLVGALRFAGGCARVVVEDGADVFVPVFPRATTTWDAASATLTVGDDAFRDGDTVSLQGSYVQGLDGATIPDECAVGGADYIFAVAP